eukprot:jgi/Astpho2/7105/Aster-08445
MDAVGYGAAGTAAAAAGPVAASTGLGALGFSSVGPVAGSYAATYMSATGAIQAGSWFALAQSAAMGGTMLFALPAAVVTGGGGLVVYSQRERIYKGASWVYNEWAARVLPYGNAAKAATRGFSLSRARNLQGSAAATQNCIVSAGKAIPCPLRKN